MWFLAARHPSIFSVKTKVFKWASVYILGIKMGLEMKLHSNKRPNEYFSKPL